MEEKKQEETTPVSTDTTSTEVTEAKDTESTVENEDRDQVEVGAEAEEAGEKTPFKGMKYIITAILVVVIGLGLIFMMEKQGRISTGIFTGVIKNMEANSPSAKVNGVIITKGDFDSGVLQLKEVAKTQGIDITDPQIISQFNTQAIETLVNGELLRQEAKEKGITVSTDELDSRLNEITEGIGGAEVLQERLEEFGITEESLRRDIENEILIQGLFDVVLEKDNSEVSEEAILGFYEQAGGEDAGLPPIDEVRDQIKEQIILNREQEQIGAYVDELRSKAEIEILI